MGASNRPTNANSQPMPTVTARHEQRRTEITPRNVLTHSAAVRFRPVGHRQVSNGGYKDLVEIRLSRR